MDLNSGPLDYKTVTLTTLPSPLPDCNETKGFELVLFLLPRSTLDVHRIKWKLGKRKSASKDQFRSCLRRMEGNLFGCDEIFVFGFYLWSAMNGGDSFKNPKTEDPLGVGLSSCRGPWARIWAQWSNGSSRKWHGRQSTSKRTRHLIMVLWKTPCTLKYYWLTTSLLSY